MTKEREEVALEADLLQMEVQRLTDLLHLKAGMPQNNLTIHNTSIYYIIKVNTISKVVRGMAIGANCDRIHTNIIERKGCHSTNDNS